MFEARSGSGKKEAPATATAVYDVDGKPLPVAEAIVDDTSPYATTSATPASDGFATTQRTNQQQHHQLPLQASHLRPMRIEVKRRVCLPGRAFRRKVWWPATVDPVPVGIAPDGNLIFNLKFEQAMAVRAHAALASFRGARRIHCGSETYTFRLVGGRKCGAKELRNFMRVSAKVAPAGLGVHTEEFLKRQEAAERRRRIAGLAAMAALVLIVLL